MPRSTNPFVDYTSRDFDAIKKSLVAYVKQRFPNDFSDLTESQLGVAILELVAYSFDVLSFSLDRTANELYLPTARTRESVIKLTSLLGYKMAPATAASVTVLVNTDELLQYTSSIVVSKGAATAAGDVVFEAAKTTTITKVDTGSGIKWQVNDDLLDYVPIDLIQGETITESSIADGTQFYSVALSQANYISNSAIVTVGGTKWKQVDSLVIGDPEDADNDNVYEVLIDDAEKAVIKFGDGISGLVPTSGTEIVVVYRKGGGETGNIAAGAFGSTKLGATVDGEDVQLSIANDNTPASGGADRETLDHARLFAPQWARTTDRAVTYRDYVALCNGFSDGSSGVIAKAGVLCDPSDGISNQVSIYVWTTDINGDLTPTVSGALKSSLQTFLETRRSISVFVAPIQDGLLHEVDVSMLLSVKPDFNKNDVTLQVEAEVKNLFRTTAVRQGNELRLAWLYDAVTAVPGVKSCTITIPSNDLFATEVPYLLFNTPAGALVAGVQNGGPRTIVTNGSHAGLAPNFFNNYRITVTNSNGLSQQFRVLASVGNTADPLLPVVFTVDKEPNPAVVPGAAVHISHPRKVRFFPTPTFDPVNRRVAFDTADQSNAERGIISYEPIRGIATLDKNVSLATFPTAARITPDIRVEQTKAIVLGDLTIEVES